jgi:hypothetical protein
MLWIDDSLLLGDPSSPIPLTGVDGTEIGVLDDSALCDSPSVARITTSASSAYCTASFALVFWQRPVVGTALCGVALSEGALTRPAARARSFVTEIACPAAPGRPPSVFASVSLTFSRSAVIRPADGVPRTLFETADARVRFSYRLAVDGDRYRVAVSPEQAGFPECPVVLALRFSSGPAHYEAHRLIRFADAPTVEVPCAEVNAALFPDCAPSPPRFSVAARELLRPMVYVNGHVTKRESELQTVDMWTMLVRLPPHPGHPEGRRTVLSFDVDVESACLVAELRFRRAATLGDNEDIESVCQEMTLRITGEHGAVTKTGFGFMNCARGVVVKFTIADLSAFDIHRKGDDKQTRPVWIDIWLPPPELTGKVPRSFARHEGAWLCELLRAFVPVYLRLPRDESAFFLTPVCEILKRFVNAPYAVSPVDVACAAALPFLEPPALVSAGEFGFLVHSFVDEARVEQYEVDELPGTAFEKPNFVVATFRRPLPELPCPHSFVIALVVVCDLATDERRLLASATAPPGWGFRHALYAPKAFPDEQKDAVRELFCCWTRSVPAAEEEDTMDDVGPNFEKKEVSMSVSPSRYGFVRLLDLAPAAGEMRWFNFLRAPACYPIRHGGIPYAKQNTLDWDACREFCESLPTAEGDGKSSTCIRLCPTPYAPAGITEWNGKQFCKLEPVVKDGLGDVDGGGIVKSRSGLGRNYAPLAVHPWIERPEQLTVTLIGIYKGRLIPATRGVPILANAPDTWEHIRALVPRLKEMADCNFTGIPAEPIDQVVTWQYPESWKMGKNPITLWNTRVFVPFDPGVDPSEWESAAHPSVDPVPEEPSS